MSFDLDLRPVHALSVLAAGSTVHAAGRSRSITVGLRLAEAVHVRQALHNTDLSPSDYRRVLRQFLGRDVESLVQIDRHELRPLLRRLDSL
ncbi:hypothetical protein ACX80U_05845 [Arthrobacter sp. TmT3-37]